MPTSVAQLVDYAVNDNAVDLKAGLDDVLRDKILHNISVVKPDVIQGMFGTHGIVPSEDSDASDETDTTDVLDQDEDEADEQETDTDLQDREED